MFSPYSREVPSLLIQRRVSLFWAEWSPVSKVWSLAIVLVMLIASLQTVNGFQRSFETKLAFLYVYYYSSPSTNLQNAAAWWTPWPNNLIGRLGWYRQGLSEVDKQRKFIQSLATHESPAILLAAAIANQGNSPQRPFGWDGPEQMQAWIGRKFDWPLPGWQGAKNLWENYFEQPSVGIGQIQPGEASRLVYAGNQIDLFDDRASIGLMQAKLVHAYQLLTELELNQTELFALLAISNNDSSDGAGLVATFQRFNNDLSLLLSYDPASRRQLARMLTYMDYLHTQDCWELPNGINRDYLWWLIRNARPTP